MCARLRGIGRPAALVSSAFVKPGLELDPHLQMCHLQSLVCHMCSASTAMLVPLSISD